MAEFSIQDAAFAGFRVARQHPKALLVWIGVSILMQLATQGVLVAMAGPAMTQLTALIGLASTDPQHVDPTKFAALAPGLAPAYLMILPISLCVYAVIYAAMNRVILRPADEGIGYLKLGPDELRQLGLRLLIGLIFVGAYLFAIFVISFLAALMTSIAMTVVAVGVLAVLGGFVYLAVKLSLASALTFHSGKIDLKGSWTLTRGRFWPLFATYLLAGVLMVVVAMLAGLVIGPITLALGGGGTTKPDYWTMAAFLTPARMAGLGLNAVLAALLWPILLTPAVSIYQQIGARTGSGLADAFN